MKSQPTLENLFRRMIFSGFSSAQILKNISRPKLSQEKSLFSYESARTFELNFKMLLRSAPFLQPQRIFFWLSNGFLPFFYFTLKFIFTRSFFHKQKKWILFSCRIFFETIFSSRKKPFLCWYCFYYFLNLVTTLSAAPLIFKFRLPRKLICRINQFCNILITSLGINYKQFSRRKAKLKKNI